MLRIIQSGSAARTRSYYSTSDYYSEGQELVGQWRGEGARRLGLKGEVQKKDWDALCDNRNPATGQPITVRQKTNRRVAYDFNFHCPKSVSVLYCLTQDDRILDAFRESVDQTMGDMEAEMKTRVRASGKNEDRIVGNMVIGQFVHLTARPVKGIADPHLHAHCVVFNTVFDDREGRWKAGQFADLKRDSPFFEAVFHSRLARRMQELGLAVERSKTGWELAGISQPTLERFSRRTALIEDEARKKGIVSDKEKDGLGAKTREQKQTGLSLDELRRSWVDQMTPYERSAVEMVASKIGGDRIAEDRRGAAEAIDLAAEHSFERKSVVPERQLLARAIKQGIGKASAESILQEYGHRDFLSADRGGRRVVSTPEVLAEETAMLDFARRGRGACESLAPGEHVFQREWLNDGQRKAVMHVLHSQDAVILVSGRAGVGKTSSMMETVEAIEAAGQRVFTFAPSAEASRGVLRQEGFANAETVARLMSDPRIQQEAKGCVWWIDEAGLLGSRAMGEVFKLANQLDSRIVLSGDRFQHGAVERGAALRLLETEAGLKPATIKAIQRQKGDYERIVQALSEGRMEDGIRRLDQLGWIRELGEEERYKQLAADYVESVRGKKSALVISPTHREAERTTHQIRAELRRTKQLAKNERSFQVLRNRNLTVAERRDAVNYSAGDVLIFQQNAKGYRKGQRVIVGKEALPLDQVERFQVFHADELSIAPGDLLRITHNGDSVDGKKHRLNNGATYQVKGFTSGGDIQLTNGWTIGKTFGHFAYGYCLTSFASQGKTVDRVFISQSTSSLPASSREQCYVSVSRAREQAVIYTDDKDALLEAVSRSDERLTATELVSQRERRERHGVIERIKRQLSTRAHERGTETRRRNEVVHER